MPEASRSLSSVEKVRTSRVFILGVLLKLKLSLGAGLDREVAAGAAAALPAVMETGISPSFSTWRKAVSRSLASIVPSTRFPALSFALYLKLAIV
jgi:hypothetical protein